MSTDKPNIRPGVRGICRNGFWTPMIHRRNGSDEWTTEDGCWRWSNEGKSTEWTALDIIGIVEDLPTVPSPQADNYEPSYTSPPGRVVGKVRMVPVAEPQPKGHWTEKDKQCTFIPHEEFEQLKADAAAWRERVANPQQEQKSYWRLLEHGEILQDGDEFWIDSRKSWNKTEAIGTAVERNWVYRRRVTAPEPQSSNDITPKQFDEIGVLLEEIDELKADAAKWREHCKNPQQWHPISEIDWTSNNEVIVMFGSPIRKCVITPSAATPYTKQEATAFMSIPISSADNDDDEPSYTSPPGKVVAKGYWVPAEHYVPPSEFEQLKADAAKWREHVANPQPAPQIPGMPEGWEVDSEREIVVNGGDGRFQPQIRIPIRRIKPPEPVCVYPLGQLKDGWLTQSSGDSVCVWHQVEPKLSIHEKTEHPYRWWSAGIREALWSPVNPPKFRDDLPCDQRIVKVGPEAEALLK